MQCLQFNDGSEEWSNSFKTLEIGKGLDECNGYHVEEDQSKDR